MSSLLKTLILLSLVYSQQGDSYYNIFKNNMSDETIDGTIYEIIEDQKRFLGMIRNGKKEGMWTEWYSNKRKLEEHYSEGVLDGAVSLYFKNGQKEWRHTYNKGILDGQWTEWNTNGKKIIEGSFDCGDSAGVWRWWNEVGELKREKKYKKIKKGFITGHNEYVVVEKIKRDQPN